MSVIKKGDLLMYYENHISRSEKSAIVGCVEGCTSLPSIRRNLASFKDQQLTDHEEDAVVNAFFKGDRALCLVTMSQMRKEWVGASSNAEELADTIKDIILAVDHVEDLGELKRLSSLAEGLMYRIKSQQAILN